MQTVRARTRRCRDGQTIAYKLLGILQDLAPDQESQRLCTKYYEAFENDQRDQDEKMAAALYDGLAYGNWPWIKLTNTGVS